MLNNSCEIPGGRRGGTVALGVLLLLMAARPATVLAQPSDSLGFFVDIAWMSGLTPVKLETASRTGLHGAIRLDAGMERGTGALGLGGRYWVLKKDETYSGSGFDAFIFGDAHFGSSKRSYVRIAGGVGNADIFRYYPLAGSGLKVHTIVHEVGPTWSIGAGHEIPVVDYRMLLTLDLVRPSMGYQRDRRGHAVLEIGLGLRTLMRTFTPNLRATRPATMSHL